MSQPKQITKDLLQLQINEIENGFVVMFPPEVIGQAPTGQLIKGNPRTVFCPDYDAVCAALRGIWPVGIAE